jgi:hypothetical protein
MLRIDLKNKIGEKEVFQFGNERCERIAERVLATIIDYAH